MNEFQQISGATAPTQSNSRYQNQNRVNTSFYTLWERNTGAQLRIGGSGSGMTLSIWLPKHDDAGTRRYPSEHRHSTILTDRNVEALSHILDTKFNSLLENRESGSVAIYTNIAQTTMLEFAYNNADDTIILNLHKECDPFSKRPNNTITFNFDKINVIESFDAISGSGTPYAVNADYLIVKKAVDAFNFFMGGGIVNHGVKIASEETYDSASFVSYITAIAAKLGVEIPANNMPQGNTSYAPREYTNNQTYRAPDATVKEVSSIDDLLV